MIASADATWWSALAHGGLLIAPSRLAEHFPQETEPLEPWIEDKLRSALDRHEVRPKQALSELLDRVLEGALGLGRAHDSETGLWDKGSNVPPEYGHRDATGTVIKPQRVWRGTARDTVLQTRAELPVFVDDADRIGVHRGRRAHARVVEWLRAMDRPLALLTNGRQWRLIHVALDSDAWAESEADGWFEEGGEGEALRGLRTLLSPSSLIPAKDGERAPLLAAIEATRRGQSELSASLGENVRMAVEVLIAAHGPALSDLLNSEANDGPPGGSRPARPQDLYVAACRMVMRLVVLHFAEAREGLLPVDGANYRDSYSLEGLRTQLERAAGSSARSRMRERGSAWPRLLALFRLIASGSTHPDLPIPRYGGGLFAAGDPNSTDAVSRAMAVFEGATFAGDDRARVSDTQVHEILRLLTRSRIKVRQGNRNTWVVAPVDFSDLSSEYIGILYEGLLDFELKRVDGDAPVVFLDLGDQPALALDRLEQMDAKAIANLVEKIGKPSKAGSDETEDDEAAEEDDEHQVEHANPSAEDIEDGNAGSTEPEGEGDDEADDIRGKARERATAWAREAVEAGKLVRKSTSKDPAKLREREVKVDALATRLVARVVLPEEWYLVRFGGTRKGSGTYYTKPQLAIPTVHRTLRPLCYDPPTSKDGTPDVDAPTAEWTPKTPEAILALKVCDPACGSGSFLVAALRFLTDALFRSLQHHGRIAEQGDGAVVRLATGDPALRLEDELLPTRPDDDQFEPRLRARLRRHLVERCIHGVDLDALAVELCRLALWIETLDRRLPFTFLDHRVKRGNALVGCWFDRFRDYPALAWEREAGDEKHSGVHHPKAARAKAIKEHKKVVQMALKGHLTGQTSFVYGADAESAEARQRELAEVLERLHTLPVHDVEARQALFCEEFQPALDALRRDFDTWCALWFWPAERAADAPRPEELGTGSHPGAEIVTRLRDELGFFHWELEFPDVFDGPTSGFDAVLGNPPWETEQPVSKEFFSNHDPLYRAYGKQEALARQQELFETDPSVEADWLNYVGHFKALANWYKQSGSPFGDPEESEVTFSFGRGRSGGTDAIHRAWRARRAARTELSDPEHPFKRQGGGKGYTYRLFLELSWAIAAADDPDAGGARLGLIVPSGVYTDKGSMELRELFLDEGRWEWLFAFENRRKIFDIHRSFKFCPLVVAKGGRTEAVRAAFMRHDLDEWSRAETVAVPYFATQVHRFSPNSRSFLEVSDKRDLEILEKIYSNSVPLGDDSEDGWGVEYRQGDFNMTSDSKLFPPRPKWEAKGYEPDEYSRWLLTDWHPRTPDSPAPPDAPRHEIEPGILLHRDGERWTHTDEVRDVALPLYQGKMAHALDPLNKGCSYTESRRGKWFDLHTAGGEVHPKFLMGLKDYTSSSKRADGFKLAFRAIARSTDQRSMIPCLLPDVPLGNAFGILVTSELETALHLQASLSTYVIDWTVRRRLGGTNLNWFVLEDLPSERLSSHLRGELALRLFAILPLFSALRLAARDHRPALAASSRLALTAAERLRLRASLDAVQAAATGLTPDELHHVLLDSDHPVGSSAATANPRGFGRVNKDLDPELRHTVLTQVAFADLQSDIRDAGGDVSLGIERFLARNDGEGWMLPETLRLADYDLGHDDRAKHPQPVAERLGPRFYDWQLAQTPEQSWRECEIHARNLAWSQTGSKP